MDGKHPGASRVFTGTRCQDSGLPQRRRERETGPFTGDDDQASLSLTLEASARKQGSVSAAGALLERCSRGRNAKPDGGGSGWIARKRPRSVPAHPCVRAAQAYSTCSGARLPLPTRAKRGGPTANRRRPNPVGKRNTGDGPMRHRGSVCVRADTLIDNRFYVVFSPCSKEVAHLFF